MEPVEHREQISQRAPGDLPGGKRALILDLDFTLLHLEHVPGSIEVPGRTRSAFIAPATVEALRDLLGRFDLVLATARSWDGTRWVSEGLQERGVPIASAVLEDGALLLAPLLLAPLLLAPLLLAPSQGSQVLGDGFQPLEPHRDWPTLRAEVESKREASWPAFEWQQDFTNCLVARADDREEAAFLMACWARLMDELNARGVDLRMFRDGRKLYLIGAKADKWAALKYLLGPRAAESAGVGDGTNDLCWLSQIALPCTMAHATPQVLGVVRERGGFVSKMQGHAGIQDALRFLGRI